MLPNISNVGAVVLAAGKGTRLNCVGEPKGMLGVGGRPMVSYIVETLEQLGFAPDQIVLVVGFRQETVRAYFGARVTYAEQQEQRGTAHAAFLGMHALPERVKTVLVIGGDDSAFYAQETLAHFITEHVQANQVLSLLTAEVADPTQYGRVVRDNPPRIIEKEYLNEEQKKIHEISTGTFCFERSWFERIFPVMPPMRKLGEYGLPTAVVMATDEGVSLQLVRLANPDEWYGVNTFPELEEARRRKS